MTYNRLLLAVCVTAFSAPLAHAQKLDADQVEKSVRYINNLQGTDGGFKPSGADTESDVGTTAVALRALKYLHPQARPRNVDAAKEFVLKCYMSAAGSFSLKPGMEPDVRSTATGLMALVELKVPLQGYGDMINRYFAENAKTLADIYIAAAALDPAKLTTPKAAEWLGTYEGTRNTDGSYGKDATQHAGAVITIMRLGGSIKNRPVAIATLRDAQRDDGGFSASPGAASDLSASYRITRALFMLREMPDSDRLRGFIARCRNDDGGYGVKPGEPSSTSATYFAAIIMHWLNELDRS